MKHAYSKCLILTALIASAFCMTSCMDDDTKEAMVISGEWCGDFGMSYTEEYRGRYYTYDADITYLTFIPDYDYATHGYGKQVDYYNYGPYEYQYFLFDWSIGNGVIYLRYRYDQQLDTRIRYNMTNSTFSGVFPETGTSFRMRKIQDFYDWTPYVSNYGYRNRPDWHGPRYAPFTRGDAAADSTEADHADGTPADGFEAGHRVVSWGRR